VGSHQGVGSGLYYILRALPLANSDRNSGPGRAWPRPRAFASRVSSPQPAARFAGDLACGHGRRRREARGEPSHSPAPAGRGRGMAAERGQAPGPLESHATPPHTLFPRAAGTGATARRESKLLRIPPAGSPDISRTPGRNTCKSLNDKAFVAPESRGATLHLVPARVFSSGRGLETRGRGGGRIGWS
jgi:hypothetical protein